MGGVWWATEKPFSESEREMISESERGFLYDTIAYMQSIDIHMWSGVWVRVCVSDVYWHMGRGLGEKVLPVIIFKPASGVSWSL